MKRALSFEDERERVLRELAGLAGSPPARQASQPSARYWIGLIMLGVAASLVVFAAVAREHLAGLGDALVAAASVPACVGIALVAREFWLSVRVHDGKSH